MWRMNPALSKRGRRSVASTVFAFAVLTAAFHGPGAAGNDLVVVSGPFSGRHAPAGKVMREAARAATGDFQIQFEDDACSAEGARLAAQQIVAVRPALVIGHPCSSAAVAAAAIYADAGIPFIATGASHPVLTDARAGPLVFRLGARDDRQGDAAARALVESAGRGARFALLHDRTAAMRALAARTQKVLAADGIDEDHVQQFPFVASELDYTDFAKRVAAFLTSQATNVEGSGILIAAYPQEAILIVRALKAQDVRVPMVGHEALADGKVGQATSWARLIVLSPRDRDFGRAAGMYVGAALRMWKAAKSADPAEPADALAARTVLLPDLGAVSFTANGDATIPSFTLKSWKEGRWSRVSSRGQPLKAASEDGHQSEGRP